MYSLKEKTSVFEILLARYGGNTAPKLNGLGSFVALELARVSRIQETDLPQTTSLECAKLYSSPSNCWRRWTMGADISLL